MNEYDLKKTGTVKYKSKNIVKRVYKYGKENINRKKKLAGKKGSKSRSRICKVYIEKLQMIEVHSVLE